MPISPEIVQRLRDAIQTDRLVQTAIQLIEIPSPTRSAAAVSDRLEQLLRDDGFSVDRPVAGWPDAPAVATRWTAGAGGRTLQCNGHLDTVHLPFVAPEVKNGVLTGSGASDMKGGIAAMYEAMRVLRETGVLERGSILLTAHDLHELPWGDGSQVDGLIREGYIGDGVLLPEYLSDQLSVIGRGMCVLEIDVTRSGEPVHEVLGGKQQPSVISAGAELIRRFDELDQELAKLTHPMAGCESIFFGQIAGGEIYNQSPTELKISGTRRWLPGTTIESAQQQFFDVLADVAQKSGTQIEGNFQVARDAFELDQQHPLVAAFQSSHTSAVGKPLPIGAKPFVDDGNTFVRGGGIAAITHGPAATGAHTVNEQVPVDELVRVALVYALTAVEFCNG